MKIKIENAYSDGHESQSIENVGEFSYDPTDPDYEGCDEREALDLYLSEFTGDGHGADDPDLGWCYTVTVLEAADSALVGHVYENCGS